MMSWRLLPILLSTLLLATIGSGCGKMKRASADARKQFPSDPAAALVADAIDADDGAQVASLIKGGANPSAVGDKGRSLIELACWMDRHNAFMALLNGGADPKHPDDDGNTVMQYAAKNENPQYMTDLIAAKVDVNLVNPSTQTTPLMAAALTDQGPQMNALIAAHANLDAQDSVGDTALIKAAQSNSYQRVIELLNAGANPGARNRLGNSFQKYLRMTPQNVLSADGKARIKQVDDFLTAHHIPLES